MKKARERLLFGMLMLVCITALVTLWWQLAMSQSRQENLANQRAAALTLRRAEPNATKVVFTDEGSYPGIGVPWSVRTKVTFETGTFKMILNEDEILGAVFKNDDEVEKYDERNKTHMPPRPLEIVYSNQKKESLK